MRRLNKIITSNVMICIILTLMFPLQKIFFEIAFGNV